MLKLDGAFAPVSTQRGPGYCRASVFPPTRFVSAQLSGGLKILYKHLGDTKNSAPFKKRVQRSQTDPEGKFQPCYPIPLLAGRYKFVQVIGRGQSSILVAAEDTFHPDKKSVAVKIMHLDYTRLGAQEADCIQQLNKADILHVSRTVQLFNVFSFESHYCLVFELLRPRPLHQYFQRCQFDSEEAKLKVIRKIALQLLQALGFLKRENVIHADLKPENILLEEGEEIKIKVVDFGNAIHWIHREVSLYYDEFELQTLLYRAPEVMFGVPFGPEIDIWSLGCILAELYIGKPLFLGRNKIEILQEVTSVLGPLPRNPFQTGKFFQELSEFVVHNPEVHQLGIVANLMKKLRNSRNYAFASFLVGLLQYNPSKRLTPCQAAMHPLLAPEFPCTYLLPWQGNEISDAARTGYTDIILTPEQYISAPHVDEEIERQQFSGAELLKKGTTVLYSGQKVSSPLLAKQTKENDINTSPQATSVNSANIQINNSRYAMEGPLTTNTSTPTYPRNKRSLTYNDRIHASKLRKKKQEPSVPVESATPAPKKSVCGSSNNYHSLALESREPSDLVKIPQRSTSISISNNVERPLVKLKICPSDNSKQDSDVIPGVYVEHSTRSHVTPEKLNKTPSPWKNNILNTKRAEDDDRFTLTATSTTTGFDLNKRLSGDETNFSARTRVYHRKTNSRKQQSNLSPEEKIHKLCHDTADQREEKVGKFGHREQCCQLVNTPVVGKSLSSQRNEKKVRVSDPLTCKLFVSMSIKHLCSEDDFSDSRGPQHCDVTNKRTKGNLLNTL